MANASIVLIDDPGGALVARFVTGAFLAVVYPPALKAASSWFRAGRGLALGIMIGALTIGSALPHLVNSIGGLPWRATLLIASGLTLAGGLIAQFGCNEGPYAAAAAPFDPGQLGNIVRNRAFRLASAGYFGHMWELYAMWAWIAAFYGDAFSSARLASLAAFGAIAIGAAGSVYAGLMSDRVSRPDAAGRALRWSASAALVTGFLVDAPWPLVLGAGLVWGFWVVADSAQFSAIVSESCDPRYVGTALTLQQCPALVDRWAGAALAVRPDVIVLVHGGPVAHPEDASFVLAHSECCHGFYGASSMERLPTELALTEQTRKFKTITFG